MLDTLGAASVRAAAPRDLYAAHAFLPWIGAAAVPLDAVFVADGPDGLCGAGALSTVQTGPHLRADVFVHPQARRHGLGSALLARLADAARAWGAQHLRTWRPTDDAPALAFLAHHGATLAGRLLTFELAPDLPAFQHRLGRRAARAATAVRPLQPADLPRLAAFYAAHLGDTPAVAAARLRAALAHPAAGALSLAFAPHGVVRAFVVFQPEDDGALRLDYWYADPAVRGTPALALIAAAASRAQALGHGLDRVRFQCRDDARSTLRLARESGARQVRSEGSHEFVL